MIQTNRAIKETNFNFAGQTGFYRGKVRDVYYFGGIMVMIATDRISAFDVILPEPIPDKGRILTLIAAQNLEATTDIVPNWLIETPDLNVAVGYRCNPYPVEMVVRGYLTGHAWREYRQGKRGLCGVPLPGDLREHDKLPNPIITPTTKAKEGHDEDISREEIINQNLVPESEYNLIEKYAYNLFDRGTMLAAKRGLILADTKYEFGKLNNEIRLIDEVHTPDSSRYFYSDGYEHRQEKGEQQKQLSKEFVRQWLIDSGFQGKPGQEMPEMTSSVVTLISARYRELYEKFTGKTLQDLPGQPVLQRIELNIKNSLNRVNFKAKTEMR